MRCARDSYRPVHDNKEHPWQFVKLRSPRCLSESRRNGDALCHTVTVKCLPPISSTRWFYPVHRAWARAHFYSDYLQSFLINLVLVFLVCWQSLQLKIQLFTFSPDTTRPPRPGETDGKQYFFVTSQSFKELIQAGAFIEHAEFSGNFYGTSFQTVRQVEQEGRRCILDIEAQASFKQYPFSPSSLSV